MAQEIHDAGGGTPSDHDQTVQRATALPSAAAFLKAAAMPISSFGDVEGARRALRQNTELIGGPVVKVSSVRDEMAPGPVQVPVRIYQAKDHGPAPTLVYFHGGGFVVGDLETVDRVCRRLAVHASCTVVSVDYRKAPECPFPAAIDDAWTVLQWMAGGGVAGVDATRLAVGGDSAGANIATVAALRAAKLGMPVDFQFLAYPVVDHRDDRRPSRAEFAEGYGLDARLIDWYRDCYLQRASDLTHPDASPLLADLRGSPPTLLLTAECDCLRDQGEEYARRLADAGVSVVAIRFLGELHGFVRADSLTRAAASSIGLAATHLSTTWSGMSNTAV